MRQFLFFLLFTAPGFDRRCRRYCRRCWRFCAPSGRVGSLSGMDCYTSYNTFHVSPRSARYGCQSRGLFIHLNIEPGDSNHIIPCIPLDDLFGISVPVAALLIFQFLTFYTDSCIAWDGSRYKNIAADNRIMTDHRFAAEN